MRASFIAKADLRSLRHIARQRQKLGGMLASEKNRLHKLRQCPSYAAFARRLAGDQPAGKTAPLLSPREQRVAHFFAAGLSYKEIARRLALQPATVRTYLRLGVRNKVQLGDALGGKTGL